MNTDTEDIRLEGEVSGSVTDKKAAPDKAGAADSVKPEGSK